MKTIGLLGGMSWESSAHYYRIVNQTVRARLGGVHSARSLMLSLDFATIERLQHDGDWVALTDAMIAAARQLERGGADLLLICTNTMHRVADEVAAGISISAAPHRRSHRRCDRRRRFSPDRLLGTAFTMEQHFYKGRLAARGLDVIVPDDADRAAVHRIIYAELVAGEVRAPSRDIYRAVIARLVARGAEAIILGCTEIMLLVTADDSAVPLFDTTELHALAAVDLALEDEG